MDADARRDFVRNNKVCVYGYTRRQDGPAMTVVYYTMDGDDLLILTMGARAKAKAVLRDPKVSVCVLDMQSPPSYVQVYCEARVDPDPELLIDMGMNIFGTSLAMSGPGETPDPPEVARGKIAELMELEGRVVLRLTPYATFYSPPTRGGSFSELVEYRRKLGAQGMALGSSLPWR
ncbi:MAG: pyridoxamine 5'-phosphate oxidase [Dehalococcoidia bacterium]|nr:pyridoxamine 5'-phosphate oxidase [Dehalococcoidia bacterium]